MAKKKRDYDVTVTWNYSAVITVSASSAEEADASVLEDQDTDGGNYVLDSYEVIDVQEAE